MPRPCLLGWCGGAAAARAPAGAGDVVPAPVEQRGHLSEYRGTVKRSAPLEGQNGVVTQAQAADRQREVASRWPSTYGQDDEADAPAVKDRHRDTGRTG